jgi:peroxiredoxin Q/BCP
MNGSISQHGPLAAAPRPAWAIATLGLVGLALVALPPLASVQAQQNNQAAPVTLRLRVAEEIRPGRQAPQVVLPYATREGPGPVDQPFDLRKELGHVVVLAFYPGDFTPGCTAEWRAFRERGETIFGPGVVVAGISGDSLDSHVRFARELDLPFKLLSDPRLVVARQYGAADGNRVKRMVVVVGRDGIIRYVDPAFAALDPQSYLQLGAAVDAARNEGSGG